MLWIKVVSNLFVVSPLVLPAAIHPARRTAAPEPIPPLFSPSGPAQRLFQGPPAESKFLAVKTILARRPGRLPSEPMIFPPNTRNPARSRRGPGVFPTEILATDAPKCLFRPLLPANPFSPPSGPLQWLFQGPPAESKFLAVIST